MRRLFILEVRANISNVRISEADNLAGIAGVGENFLIAGETGIENDFAAATGACPRRAALKDPPVLQREDSGPRCARGRPCG